MRIFFAGPLTDLKNPEATKVFYLKLAGVATSNKFQWFWAFLNGTDPIKNPEVPANVVYETDLEELAKSDLMVIYLGEPSTGTGQEIEYAKEHNIPAYLLYEKGTRITRMVLGSPNIKGTIEFTSESDALAQLDTLLKSLS
ncbi:MAG: XRE family transcriptional regulator [Candidatus Gottesmanbacteria bacterium]|nr:XRE family transcriptional regulator [Candidatus Gottesmanbacteria bacterium]